MIEQVMIFTLGFLVAGLLTLLFLPAYGRRATRLARRRLEMQMPLSMAEIVADRDQLRASLAVEQRRIEQRAEALENQNARHLADLGRASAAQASLRTDLAAARQEHAALQQALEAAQRETNETQATLSSTIKDLYDNSGLLDRRTAALGELKKAHDTLKGLAEERRATIAGLETRLAGLEMRLSDSGRDLIGARAALEERVGVQQKRIAELEEEMRLQRDSVARSVDVGQGHQREAAAADERARVLRASLERQTELLRTHEQDFEKRLETLREDNDVLRGALETARREHRDVRRELVALQALRPNFAAHDAAAVAAGGDVSGDTPILRRAISDIGNEVLRLAAAIEARGVELGKDTAPETSKDGVTELKDVPPTRLRELQDVAARSA